MFLMVRVESISLNKNGLYLISKTLISKCFVAVTLRHKWSILLFINVLHVVNTAETHLYGYDQCVSVKAAVRIVREERHTSPDLIYWIYLNLKSQWKQKKVTRLKLYCLLVKSSEMFKVWVLLVKMELRKPLSASLTVALYLFYCELVPWDIPRLCPLTESSVSFQSTRPKKHISVSSLIFFMAGVKCTCRVGQSAATTANTN